VADVHTGINDEAGLRLCRGARICVVHPHRVAVP
jgi:hypothetical protein